jgi:hypothetical protein
MLSNKRFLQLQFVFRPRGSLRRGGHEKSRPRFQFERFL